MWEYNILKKWFIVLLYQEHFEARNRVLFILVHLEFSTVSGTE